MGVTFKAFDLIVDGSTFTERFRNGLFENQTTIFHHGGIIYSFTHEYNEQQGYYWIAVRYDTGTFSDIVYNVSLECEQDNPRSLEQKELNKQFFVFYHIKNDILYLSDKQKKAVLLEYLSNCLNAEVLIKNLYCDIHDFSKKLKKISEIRFIYQSNLINMTDDGIIPSIGNRLGIDYPDKMYVKMSYDKRDISNFVQDGINSLLGLKQRNDRGEISQLVIAGYSDDDFEMIFNMNNYMPSITLPVEKESSNMYDETIGGCKQKGGGSVSRGKGPYRTM